MPAITGRGITTKSGAGPIRRDAPIAGGGGVQGLGCSGDSGWGRLIPSLKKANLWDRACPRTPAWPVPATALDSSRVNPLPQAHHSLQRNRSTCGSGFTREHRRSRCHTPRRILRGHARSHRITTAFNAATVPVGAGSPANTGAAGASHRVGFFAGKPAPTEALAYL